MASYGSLFDSSYKPTGSNFLEQAYTPIKQTLVDAYNTPRNPGLPYSYKAPVVTQNNYQSVLTTPQARNYDAATGRLRVQPQVDPIQLQQFFKGQSQEAVGNLGTVLPNFDSSFVRNAPIIGPDNIPYLGSRMDNAPLAGYPYRGEFYNEDTFTQGGQPTGVPSAPQVPSKVPAAVVTPSQYSQPAARTSAVSSVGQPASNVQVQPTQSGQISPIGLQGVTSAMAAPTTYVPEGQQVNPSWFQSTIDKLGEFLGVQNGTQYLKNSDGSLMVDASGNNIVDTSGRTWGDIGAGIKGAADIGMGLFGMFTSMDQNQHALDTQRGQLNLMREKYAEDKRKNQAIVAQNSGA